MNLMPFAKVSRQLATLFASFQCFPDSKKTFDQLQEISWLLISRYDFDPSELELGDHSLCLSA